MGPLKLISQALKSWQALSAIVLCVPEFAKTNMSTEEMELNASKENYIYSVPKIVSQLSIRNLKKKECSFVQNFPNRQNMIFCY